MSFAINILALLLVLGLCWIAMVWLSGRHGHGIIIDEDRPRDPVSGPPPPDPGTMRVTAQGECAACEGVGASHVRGRVVPCPACDGTGVLGSA